MLQMRRGRRRPRAVGRIAIFLGGIHKQEEWGALSADPAVYQFPGDAEVAGTRLQDRVDRSCELLFMN